MMLLVFIESRLLMPGSRTASVSEPDLVGANDPAR
jgi:hypothetical protein